MTRSTRVEGWVQIGIMLVMGGVAAAASFTHIHDLAVVYGQPSPVGWANAIVVELMSIVAGLEIRRRKRTGQSAGFVYLVFCCAVLISLAAQVAKAHPSAWGWIMAALPALGFLAVVKIVLTRQPVGTEPDRTGVTDVCPVQATDRTRDLNSQPSTDELARAQRTGRDRTSSIQLADASITSAAPSEASTQVPPPRTAERFASSPADPIQHGTIGELDRISGAELDRSAGSPLPQDLQVHDKAPRDAGDDAVERHGPRSGPQDTPTNPAGDRPVDTMSGPVHVRTANLPGPDGDRSARDAPRLAHRSGPDPDLLELGRTIAAAVAIRKGKLTRQALIDEIRGTGRTISTDRASDLLQCLKENGMPHALST